MDQAAIGGFITRKRKEKNLTQEQLAEKLGVSNKTVSKWECGKCMPDYYIIESLCGELGVTLAELMQGEEDEKSIHTYDDREVIEMMKEVRRMKDMKLFIFGAALFLIGIAMMVFSGTFGGSNVQDFISGLMDGIGIACVVVAAYLFGRYIASLKENGKK